MMRLPKLRPPAAALSLRTQLSWQTWALVMLQLLALLAALWFWLRPQLLAQQLGAMQTAAEAISQQLSSRVASANASTLNSARLLQILGSDGQRHRSDLLAALHQQSPSIVTSYLVDRSKRLSLIYSTEVDSRLQAQRLGLDMSASPALRQVTDNRPGFTEPFLSSLSERLMIASVQPAGEAGWLVAEVSLQALTGELRDIAEQAHLSAMIVDGYGRVIAHRDAAAAGRSVELTAQQLEALQAPEVLKTMMLDGMPWYVFRRPLETEGLGWQLLILSPQQSVQAPVRLVLWSALALSALLAAALWLGVRWQARRLAARAAMLGEQADRMAAGDAPLQTSTQVAEFDQVLGHLQTLATRVHEREAALQALNADLEGLVAQRTQHLEASKLALENALDTLHQTQADLIHAGKLAALGELVANLAHELNTPIGNAVMAASTIKSGAGELQQGFQAGSLTRTQAQRALTLLKDSADVAERNLSRAGLLVSTFKQVAVDQTTEQYRPFALGTLLQETATMLSPRLGKCQARLSLQIVESVDMVGYPGPLSQVLINLVENALMHGLDNGPGDIEIQAEWLQGVDDRVRLTVRDHGKGMSPEVLAHIYEPFFTTKRNRGGTGLGMTIVHNLITGMLQGQIEVQSELGQGSAFIVNLPRVIPPRASEATA